MTSIKAFCFILQKLLPHHRDPLHTLQDTIRALFSASVTVPPGFSVTEERPSKPLSGNPGFEVLGIQLAPSQRGLVKCHQCSSKAASTVIQKNDTTDVSRNWSDFQTHPRKGDRTDSENHGRGKEQIRGETPEQLQIKNSADTASEQEDDSVLHLSFPSKAEVKLGQVELLNLSGIIKN